MKTSRSKSSKRTMVSRARASAQGVIDFELFAPYNEVVQLLGSWNDWKPIHMVRHDDGRFRVEVPLPDGEHQYRFRVKSQSPFAHGNMVEVFDPYALSITNDDPQNAIIRVVDGKRADVDYYWQHDRVHLPENRDLVLYELHVGDFPGAKNQRCFTDVIQKLDYLRELGVNGIELMPVKEFPGKGWGYSLRSLFAVENSYGPAEDLCRLVDEAHARGMRVIIDGVYNHAEERSPLTQIDYEYWFHKENPDPKEMQWGPKFNFGHYDQRLDVFPARKYVIESIRFWVETFHIDGIRFDATRAIKDFDVMRELVNAAFDKIEGIKPFICIAEHVPEDPAITGRPDEGPMNAAWNDGLAHQLQCTLTGKERGHCKPFDLDAIEQKMNPAANGYKTGERFVTYLSSHDHDRLMYIIGKEGNLFGEAAFRRMKLGFGLLLTAPGIPMIWMGNEFGFACAKTLDPCPLDWGLLKNPDNASLLDYVKRVSALRHEHAALRGDAFEVILKDGDRGLLAYKRWNGGGNVVVIVANLKDEPAGEFGLENVGLEDGVWKDAIHGNQIHVENGVLKDVIDASEVKIYVKEGEREG